MRFSYNVGQYELAIRRTFAYTMAFLLLLNPLLLMWHPLSAQASDGSGTATISPSAVRASSSGNTMTVTYTAAETMDSGEVAFTAPSGWTAPQGSNGSAGYTTVSSIGTLAKVEDTADSSTNWAAGTACASGAPSADTTTKHEGTGSISCANGNEAAGDVWYKNISSENWSSFTTAGFWIYSSGALTSGHLQFSYDDTANLASPLESLSLPAISATTWTYVTLTFGSTTRTGVVAYGLRVNNASGVDNKTVKIDDLLLGPYSTITFSGQDAKMRILSLASTQTVTYTYGSGGGASGATAPATLGSHTFTVKNRVSDSTSSLTNISTSPTVDVAPAATKALVGLTGQTVNGSSITSSCPTIGGGTAITIAGTPTATTAGTAITACVYATDGSNQFDSLATNTTSITSTPTDSQGTYPSSAALVSGVKAFSITFKTSGSYTVTGTPTSLTAGTSSSVTINPGSTTKLVITTNPSSVTAGSQTTSYVVTRRDQYDNATTSGSQTVNLSSDSTGANKQFRDSSNGAGVSSISIANGNSTEDFYYFDEKSGAWTISVAFSGLTGDSKSLTVNPGSTTNLVITSNPSSVTAGNETTSYVVQRRDTYGNAVTSGSQTVNLSSTSGSSSKQFRDSAGGGSVSSVTIANSASTEDFYYYDETAGSYTIAVAGSGLTGDSKSLTVNAGSVNKLVITSNPSSHTAGQETTAYTVQRRDQYENPITSGTQTVNLSSTSTGSNKAFRDSSGGPTVTSVTIGAGSSTEDFYYYDEKSGSWTIAVSGTSLTGDSKSLITNAAATSQLVITTNPSTVTAGNETTSYVVSRKDQYGNLTTSGTQTVNLSSTSTGSNKAFRDSSGGGTVTSVTIGAGSSTEDFYYYDEKSGSWTIAVSGTSLTGDSKSLTVNATSTTTLVITSNPSSVTAGNETTSYVVTRRDTYGNAVTSGSQTVNLTTTSSSSSKQFRDSSGGAGVSSISIANGNSTEDFYYFDETSGSYTIAVAGAGLTGDSKSLTVSPGSTTNLVITSNPSSVTAGNETTSYVVQRRDTYGNAVTSGSQTVNLASTSSGANKAFRDSSGGATVTSVTIANSASTEDFYYYDEAAGSYTISVSGTGLTGDSEALTVNPGSTATLVLTSNPSSVTAGSETTSYVVSRQDAYGNTTSSGSQTVNLSSTSTGSNKAFRDSSGGATVSSVTITNGNTTQDFFYYDEAAGSWTISVDGSGLTGDTAALTVNPASTSQLVITSNPSTGTAGQETTAYVVTRKDQYGNATSSGSQTVNLASTSTGSNKQFRDTSGGSTVSSVSISNGSSTEDFYYYDEKSGSWTISVSGSGLTGDSKSLTINPATTSKLVLTSYPSTVAAGSETTAYVVQRQDQFSNATTSGSQTVTLSSSSGSSNKSFRDTSGGSTVSSVTITNGNSTQDFFYFDDQGGTYTISVSASGLTGDSQSLTVTSSVVFVITSAPSSTVAGTESTAFTVQRQDNGGNPLTSGSQTVNLSTTSGSSSKEFRSTSGGSSVSSVTIQNGASTATFYYYDELAASYTISVSASSVTGDSTSLIVTPGSTNRLVLTTYPSSVIANEVTSAYTVERRDTYSNLVTSGSQTVSLTSTSTGSYEFRETTTGSSVSAITITNGSSNKTFYYKDPVAGTWTITISATGITGDSKTITVTAASSDSSSDSSTSSPSPATTSTASPTATRTSTPRVTVTITPSPTATAETSPSLETPIDETTQTTSPSSIIIFISNIANSITGFIGSATDDVITGIQVVGNTIAIQIGNVGTQISILTSQTTGLVKVAFSSLANGVTTITVAIAHLAESSQQTATSNFNSLIESSNNLTAGLNATLITLGRSAQGTTITVGTAFLGATKTIGTGVTNGVTLVSSASRTVGNSLTVLVVTTGRTITQSTTALSDQVAASANRISIGVQKFTEVVFDKEPNHISNVQTAVTSSHEVIITWQTNHLSTSKVNYGSAVGVYEHEKQSTDYTRNHRLVLTDLKPGTQYYFEVLSQNGNLAVDAFRSFTTPQ